MDTKSARVASRPATILAPAVRPGDTIGIVSPSWFGGDALLPRARRGSARLERLGFGVKIAAHVLDNRGHQTTSSVVTASSVTVTTVLFLSSIR